MNLDRNVTLWFSWILDEWIPPILRDSKLFMWLPFRLFFGRKDALFRTFKDRAHDMTFAEFKQVYSDAQSAFVRRPTDLNDACIAKIPELLVGTSVLDVGCGHGALAGLLSNRAQVSAIDIFVSEEVRDNHPSVFFEEGDLQALPYADGAFDTVVCTHTLEHVLDISVAVAELRRVCNRRLIIVVPKQRPYRFTFDLHLHFFPYPWSLLQIMNHVPGQHLELVGGDWLYWEG
jgi:ubiquinone/menaquinone biosynthesis C-methylase UbiE